MLVAFAIFGISVAVGLITLVLYLNPGLFGRHGTSIPGPLVVDPKEGNLLDISQQDGSLHRYLSQIHAQFGKIVAFFMGKRLVVSLSSLDLVEEHLKAFNDAPGRPFELFEAIVPRHHANKTGRITSSSSKTSTTNDPTIGYQQRAQEAKIKSIRWSPLSINHMFQRYVALTYEMANKWMAQCHKSSSGPQQQQQQQQRHIGLASSCLGLGAKCASITLLGEFYADDRVVFEFKRKADKYWTEISDRLKDGIEISEKREKAIRDSLEELQRVMKGHVQCWFESEKATPPARWTITDYLMDKDLPQEEVSYQLLCYFLVMLNTTGHLVSWTLYNLAKHPDIHDDLVKELLTHYDLHGADAMKREVWESCAHLRHVLMETARQVPLLTWSSRSQDFELPCGSDSIPASSLVLYPIGVLAYDRDIWGSKPQQFRPRRFEEEPRLEAFMRKLLPIPKSSDIDAMFPTFSYSFVVASVLVAELALKFHFRLVTPPASTSSSNEDPLECSVDDGSTAPTRDLGFGGCGRADVAKNFKMLTTPMEEIYITVTPRK